MTSHSLQFPHEHRVGSTLDFIHLEDGTIEPNAGVAVQFRLNEEDETGPDDILEFQFSLKAATLLGLELIQVAEQGIQTATLVNAIKGDDLEKNLPKILKLLESMTLLRTGSVENIDVRSKKDIADGAKTTS